MQNCDWNFLSGICIRNGDEWGDFRVSHDDSFEFLAKRSTGANEGGSESDNLGPRFLENWVVTQNFQLSLPCLPSKYYYIVIRQQKGGDRGFWRNTLLMRSNCRYFGGRLDLLSRWFLLIYILGTIRRI